MKRKHYTGDYSSPTQVLMLVSIQVTCLIILKCHFGAFTLAPQNSVKFVRIKEDSKVCNVSKNSHVSNIMRQRVMQNNTYHKLKLVSVSLETGLVACYIMINN